MKIKIKRLWNGLASVRDYKVEEAKSKNEPIVLVYNKQEMKVTDYSKFFQTNKASFSSKFSKKSYKLMDIHFKPKEDKCNSQPQVSSLKPPMQRQEIQLSF